MLAFKSWLVDVVINDPTMQGYIPTSGQTGKYNIFPVDVDVAPEDFPCITYQDVANIILTVPAGNHVGEIQLNIWSTNSALETENIYERLAQLLNLTNQLTSPQAPTGTLWWIKEIDSKDFHTPSRRIWHKALTLKYWYLKSNGS